MRPLDPGDPSSYPTDLAVQHGTNSPDQRTSGTTGWTHRIVLGGITIGALCLALRQVSFDDASAALSQANPLPLLGALAMLAITMWAKTERWRWLLNSEGSLRRRPLLLSLLIGYLGNTILPARLGEAVRAYSLSQMTATEVPTALSTILVEKVLDIGTLLAFLLGLVLVVPSVPWAAQASLLGGAIFLGLTIAVVVLTLKGEWLVVRLARIRERAPAKLKAGTWWQWPGAFLQGFRTLRSRHTASMAMFWSLIVWLSGGAINLLVLKAFGIEPLLPAAILTLVVTNFGAIVPSAPSYIGVYHYLSVFALSAFAIPAGVAFGYAVVIHALVFGSFAIGGATALVVAGLDWRTLRLKAGGNI